MPLALHSDFSDLRRSPAALTSIPTTFGCLFFLIVQASNFFSPPFPTQSVRLPLVTYPSLCSTCVTYRTPCHASSHQLLPTLPLSTEVDNFPRGDKHSKHAPPLTYLVRLQLIINNSRLIFKHVKTTNALFVVKILAKNHEIVATLINSC